MDLLIIVKDFFWDYIGFVVICIGGMYLTIISKGLQFKILLNIKYNITELLNNKKYTDNHLGVHPIKLYFTSIGGMIGIGNIVNIGSAVMIGGPGSIFWMWIASFMGMIIKYSEIYLGVKYREPNNQNGYNGGPMYYLKEAFNKKWICYLSAFLLCIYGVEVYQFNVLVNRFEYTFHISKNIAIMFLLIGVLYSAVGGIKRVANICSTIMPIFMIIYIVICLYVIILHMSQIPSLFLEIITSAFQGHSMIGGFIGSSVLLSTRLGVSKAVYSGDIGVGYDSVVQSETKVIEPKIQAQLAIYALFSDTFICFMTTLVLSITGAWYTMNNVAHSNIMALLLANYIDYADIFMTMVLFFAGFTTIIAFMSVGIKASTFICDKYGKNIYLGYAIIAFPVFSYLSQDYVIAVMELSGGILVLLNVIGILKLVKKIEF